MMQVHFSGLVLDSQAGSPLMTLVSDDGKYFLDMVIGPVEAGAIAMAHQGIQPPRPMTHDLLVDVINAGPSALASVAITALEDSTYFAELIFDDGKRLSCRPSDAVSVALRAGVTMLAAPSLLKRIEGEESEESEIAEFKEFLEQLNPEDFA